MTKSKIQNPNKSFNLLKNLKIKQEIINKALEKWLPPPHKSKIARAMHYAVFAGGKRFRPILMLAVAEVFGKNPKRVLPFAAAVEMIHTFTLIHDDLPAMDNDDFRRGKPACHRRFGEDIAILTGDALQALAFEIIACQKGPTSAQVLLQVMQTLAHSLGVEGVVGGQELDMGANSSKPSLSELYQVHQKKTAALIEAAVQIAAVVCGASLTQQKELKQYARYLGLAFQIKDDLLDETASFSKLGKNPGSDKRNKKATFPLLMGKEVAQQKMKKELREALKAAAKLGKRGTILKDLALYILDR